MKNTIRVLLVMGLYVMFGGLPVQVRADETNACSEYTRNSVIIIKGLQSQTSVGNRNTIVGLSNVQQSRNVIGEIPRMLYMTMTACPEVIDIFEGEDGFCAVFDAARNTILDAQPELIALGAETLVTQAQERNSMIELMFELTSVCPAYENRFFDPIQKDEVQKPA